MTTKELLRSIEYLRSCSNTPLIQARFISAFLLISSKEDIGQSELKKLIGDGSSTSRVKQRLLELRWVEEFVDPDDYKSKRLRTTSLDKRVIEGMPTKCVDNLKIYPQKATNQIKHITDQLEHLSSDQLNRIEQTIAMLKL